MNKFYELKETKSKAEKKKFENYVSPNKKYK